MGNDADRLCKAIKEFEDVCPDGTWEIARNVSQAVVTFPNANRGVIIKTGAPDQIATLFEAGMQEVHGFGSDD